MQVVACWLCTFCSCIYRVYWIDTNVLEISGNHNLEPQEHLLLIYTAPAGRLGPLFIGAVCALHYCGRYELQKSSEEAAAVGSAAVWLFSAGAITTLVLMMMIAFFSAEAAIPLTVIGVALVGVWLVLVGESRPNQSQTRKVMLIAAFSLCTVSLLFVHMPTARCVSPSLEACSQYPRWLAVALFASYRHIFTGTAAVALYAWFSSSKIKETLKTGVGRGLFAGKSHLAFHFADIVYLVNVYAAFATVDGLFGTALYRELGGDESPHALTVYMVLGSCSVIVLSCVMSMILYVTIEKPLFDLRAIVDDLIQQQPDS